MEKVKMEGQQLTNLSPSVRAELDRKERLLHEKFMEFKIEKGEEEGEMAFSYSDELEGYCERVLNWVREEFEFKEKEKGGMDRNLIELERILGLEETKVVEGSLKKREEEEGSWEKLRSLVAERLVWDLVPTLLNSLKPTTEPYLTSLMTKLLLSTLTPKEGHALALQQLSNLIDTIDSPPTPPLTHPHHQFQFWLRYLKNQVFPNLSHNIKLNLKFYQSSLPTFLLWKNKLEFEIESEGDWEWGEEGRKDLDDLIQGGFQYFIHHDWDNRLTWLPNLLSYLTHTIPTQTHPDWPGFGFTPHLSQSTHPRYRIDSDRQTPAPSELFRSHPSLSTTAKNYLAKDTDLTELVKLVKDTDGVEWVTGGLVLVFFGSVVEASDSTGTYHLPSPLPLINLLTHLPSSITLPDSYYDLLLSCCYAAPITTPISTTPTFTWLADAVIHCHHANLRYLGYLHLENTFLHLPTLSLLPTLQTLTRRYLTPSSSSYPPSAPTLVIRLLQAAISRPDPSPTLLTSFYPPLAPLFHLSSYPPPPLTSSSSSNPSTTDSADSNSQHLHHYLQLHQPLLHQLCALIHLLHLKSPHHPSLPPIRTTFLLPLHRYLSSIASQSYFPQLPTAILLLTRLDDLLHLLIHHLP